MELGIVVVTHGRLGEEMVRVATHIMGEKLRNVLAVQVPFMSEASAAEFSRSATPFAARRSWIEARVLEAVQEVDRGGGVIVLTDIVGGTAFNVCRGLLESRQGALLAGVNLPMLLKIPSVRAMAVDEAARELAGRSRSAIEMRIFGAAAP